MTGTDGIVSWTCTRIQLIDVFRDLPLTRHMHLEALGGLADSVLAALPEVPAEQSQRAFDAGAALATQAERERCAKLAEERKARYPVTYPGEDGYLSVSSQPFAPLIREQP